LEALQQPVGQKYQGDIGVTPAQYISCYKRYSEKISSGLSKRHVGHFKVAVKYPLLVEMYSMAMTLPFSRGFVPERWKLLIDVMLPKDAGSFYCHCMRIIRLCESDFNQALGIIFARPIGHLLEDNKTFPEMQFGSRDGQMSISAVLNKQLTFDIARLQRTTMSTVEFDAIGCYGCIIQVIPSLYLQRLGVSILALTTVCWAFDEAIHFIKTSYGISSATYRATPEMPLYGAGQGTTIGPFFGFLSFVLFMNYLIGP
jgi:hypothetical protein